MCLKKILSKLRMYKLNFEGPSNIEQPTVKIGTAREYTHTIPCQQCGAEYHKSRRALHIETVNHQKAVITLNKRKDELMQELRAIKMILNSPQ